MLPAERWESMYKKNKNIENELVHSPISKLELPASVPIKVEKAPVQEKAKKLGVWHA